MQNPGASQTTQPAAQFGLSIVIVTYNSASVLLGLLDSLPSGMAGIKQFETIVVDNDSADNSVEIALAHPIRPRSHQNGPKWRLCGGYQCSSGHGPTRCASADSQPRHPSSSRCSQVTGRSLDRFVHRRRGAADAGRRRNLSAVAAAGTLAHNGMDGCYSWRNTRYPYRYGRDDR